MCNNKIKECMPHEFGARCNPGKAATKASSVEGFGSVLGNGHLDYFLPK